MSSILRVDDVQTATYLSVALKGNVLYGVTAIEPIVARLTSEVITSKEELIAEADAVVVDGNLTREALKTAIALAHHHQKFIWFDPADQSKVEKLFAAKSFELSTRFRRTQTSLTDSWDSKQMFTHCCPLLLKLEAPKA
ncbi:hypothetical protein L596_015960 [Steinernema carpocapsae]|uniref:Carbohydrate kinase PfkB domain-containing protein n=1 Tax=Steinernema carpocapsae TaxID=34508 RepID=A0A4U5NHK4_STECR|nr:hypothetical protein L596_015960 [Steinernema carpocapsae]